MNQSDCKVEGHPVRLNADEVFAGASIGLWRRVRCIFAKNAAGEDVHWKGGEWGSTIESAIAEVAVAREMSRHWSGLGIKVKYDVGERVSVRHTEKLDGHLIVEERDPIDSIIVMVVGRAPEYRIVGLISCAEARNIGQWREPPAVRRASWWLRQDQLHRWDPLYPPE